MEQMDVVTAFLYGLIDKDVYVEYLTGCEHPKDKVYKLKKALYGLKQSPRLSYQTISKTLEALGFVRSIHDHSLFLNKIKETYTTLYVDNMKILGPNMEFIDLIKKQLAISYKMTDLGPSAMYPGMEIS
ncbi:gag-pol polyprotein [Lasallia pustulata]|uniref:Gag-pol polyprotein n=1 Tax=Lasallia pustulata TaxID=136370 RepID=A0A1W5D866_9LECA|nr:gag-pol polyprotein [Lasallia pustulata]